jgi:hypothetical protein
MRPWFLDQYSGWRVGGGGDCFFRQAKPISRKGFLITGLEGVLAVGRAFENAPGVFVNLGEAREGADVLGVELDGGMQFADRRPEPLHVVVQRLKALRESFMSVG